MLERIAAHARAAAPDECCGLLVGHASCVDEAVPTANVAADPGRQYEVPPAEYAALVRRCRTEGRSVVGAYHSHPHTLPLPSATDTDAAFSDFWFLIGGPVDGSAAWSVRAYRLRDERLCEEPIVVVPVR